MYGDSEVLKMLGDCKVEERMHVYVEHLVDNANVTEGR